MSIATATESVPNAYIQNRSFSERSKKTRIYTSATNEEILDRFGLVTPAFGSHRGDGSDSDLAWREYNRAELKIMREKAVAWLQENNLGDVKIQFVRTAGCSCPCSPGFVADRIIRINGAEVSSITPRS